MRSASFVVLLALALAGSTFAFSVRTITGTARADVLRGTDGRDVIRGLGGKDILHGAGGSDRLDGGAGDDRWFGGPGDDSLVTADDGYVDRLYGGGGDDLLVSRGTGAVYMFGGPGNDVLRGRSARKVGGYSLDTLSGGPGDDKLLRVDMEFGDWVEDGGCGAGNDVVELMGLSHTPEGEEAWRRKGCERVIFREG
jgi:Ca2+-binding RTX toxin-like protein